MMVSAVIGALSDSPGNLPALLLLAGTFVTTVGGVVVAVISNRRVHTDNRKDHQETAAKVDQLITGQSSLAADVRDIKADIRDLRDADRHQEQRIDNLEHPSQLRQVK